MASAETLESDIQIPKWDLVTTTWTKSRIAEKKKKLLETGRWYGIVHRENLCVPVLLRTSLGSRLSKYGTIETIELLDQLSAGEHYQGMRDVAKLILERILSYNLTLTTLTAISAQDLAVRLDSRADSEGEYIVNDNDTKNRVSMYPFNLTETDYNKIRDAANKPFDRSSLSYEELERIVLNGKILKK